LQPALAFGLDHTTSVSYVNAARHLLDGPAAEHAQCPFAAVHSSGELT
jgi:hypothetical protein